MSLCVALGRAPIPTRERCALHYWKATGVSSFVDIPYSPHRPASAKAAHVFYVFFVSAFEIFMSTSFVYVCKLLWFGSCVVVLSVFTNTESHRSTHFRPFCISVPNLRALFVDHNLSLLALSLDNLRHGVSRWSASAHAQFCFSFSAHTSSESDASSEFQSFSPFKLPGSGLPVDPDWPAKLALRNGPRPLSSVHRKTPRRSAIPPSSKCTSSHDVDRQIQEARLPTKFCPTT